MLKELLLFLLAILPVIILGCYVYTKDKNREPMRILIKLFSGGLLAAVLTVIITCIIQHYVPFFDKGYESDTIGIFIYSFIIVGFVEELSKWIMLYLFSYNDKEFDELYDMIVYSVFVALGFAWIENLLYVYDGGITTAILRIFLAVPAHISLGIFMGYFLSLAKLADINGKIKIHKKYMLLSVFIPFLFHGIYDYCLFSENIILIFLFLLFVVVLYISAFRKLKFLSSLKNNLIKYYCSSCGKKINNEEKYCSKCGKKI